MNEDLNLGNIFYAILLLDKRDVSCYAHVHTSGGQVDLRINHVGYQHQFRFKSVHKAFSRAT